MAFAHVDDLVRFLGIEANHDTLPNLQGAQSRPAPAVWRRQMRFADFGRKIVLGQRRFDTRFQVAAISLVVGVLDLASPAFREKPARRLLVVRTVGERAIVEDRISGDAEGYVAAGRRHAVAARRNADD